MKQIKSDLEENFSKENHVNWLFDNPDTVLTLNFRDLNPNKFEIIEAAGQYHSYKIWVEVLNPKNLELDEGQWDLLLTFKDQTGIIRGFKTKLISFSEPSKCIIQIKDALDYRKTDDPERWKHGFVESWEYGGINYVVKDGAQLNEADEYDTSDVSQHLKVLEDQQKEENKEMSKRQKVEGNDPTSQLWNSLCDESVFEGFKETFETERNLLACQLVKDQDPTIAERAIALWLGEKRPQLEEEYKKFRLELEKTVGKQKCEEWQHRITHKDATPENKRFYQDQKEIVTAEIRASIRKQVEEEQGARLRQEEENKYKKDYLTEQRQKELRKIYRDEVYKQVRKDEYNTMRAAITSQEKAQMFLNVRAEEANAIRQNYIMGNNFKLPEAVRKAVDPRLNKETKITNRIL